MLASTEAAARNDWAVTGSAATGEITADSSAAPATRAPRRAQPAMPISRATLAVERVALGMSRQPGRTALRQDAESQRGRQLGEVGRAQAARRIG